MSAMKALERKEVAVDDLIPQEINPNKMSKRKFNLLVENIEQMGLTDPILVRPHPEQAGKYRIIGGAHRWEAAKLIGYTQVPVTVVTDPSFDDDAERFQIVRHNIIKGEMDAGDFIKLYESLAKKYEADVAAELFGFEEQSEFNKLVAATAKTLPKEMQAEFKEAAKEIKTVDGLAAILNRLFTEHGDTLPYGYMIFDFGGKDSVWLRMKAIHKNYFMAMAKECKARGVTVDSAMMGLLKNLTTGTEMKAMFDAVVADLEKVEIPKEVELPSLDYLDQLDAIDGEE